MNNIVVFRCGLKMALFLMTQLLVDGFVQQPGNVSFFDDYAAPVNVPEILMFQFFPNPALEGQLINVTCVVRPANSQVLIIRLRDNYVYQDSANRSPNDTISVYGAEESGVLWGAVPWNRSGSYICEARNYRGLVRSRKVNLILRRPPRSASIHVDFNTTVGTSMRNSVIRSAFCSVVADVEPFEYQWMFLPGNISNGWILLPSSSKVINVSADNPGTFKCCARTDVGWSTWSPSVVITPARAYSALAALDAPSQISSAVMMGTHVHWVWAATYLLLAWWPRRCFC